jgi:hypothetical protein
MTLGFDYTDKDLQVIEPELERLLRERYLDCY